MLVLSGCAATGGAETVGEVLPEDATRPVMVLDIPTKLPWVAKVKVSCAVSASGVSSPCTVIENTGNQAFNAGAGICSIDRVFISL
jgi:hypothetical protein